MIRIENHCVGCTDLGLPCLGHRCPNRRVPVRYCDKCGTEITDGCYYMVDGEDLCEECLKDKFAVKKDQQ